MVPGCPHRNPARRPRGSNCFGIFPEQCGANRAALFLGQPLTPQLRSSIEAIGPPGGVRFIRPGETVIQNLSFGRLNIGLDAQGTVERADCYYPLANERLTGQLDDVNAHATLPLLRLTRP